MYVSDKRYEDLKSFIKDKSLEEFKIFFLELCSGVEGTIHWYRDTGPLHIAADYGRVDIASYLLTKPVANTEIDVNSTSKSSWFPLHFAASKGHLDMCKLLIKHGANLGYIYRPNPSLESEYNDFTTPNLPTPLYIAAKNNKIKVVKLLLLYKADPLAIDQNGNTAFQIAKQNNFTDIIANYFEFTRVAHELTVRENIELVNPFEQLPTEVIGEIFSYLNLSDVSTSQ